MHDLCIALFHLTHLYRTSQITCVRVKWPLPLGMKLYFAKLECLVDAHIHGASEGCSSSPPPRYSIEVVHWNCPWHICPCIKCIKHLATAVQRCKPKVSRFRTHSHKWLGAHYWEHIKSHALYRSAIPLSWLLSLIKFSFCVAPVSLCVVQHDILYSYSHNLLHLYCMTLLLSIIYDFLPHTVFFQQSFEAVSHWGIYRNCNLGTFKHSIILLHSLISQNTCSQAIRQLDIIWIIKLLGRET